MPLFNFSLKLIKECEPFGTTPDLRLHWFGLTDGFYHLKVGEVEVLKYTPEIMQEGAKKGWQTQKLPYPDYYVVRLFEDLLEILPYIYEEVPAEVAQYVAAPERNTQFDLMYEAWISQLDSELLDPQQEQVIEDVAETSIGWRRNCYLSSAHLQKGPLIWFWRTGEQVHIRWDCSGKSDEGVPFWTSESGEYSILFQEFQAEIEDFNQRFIGEMRERVESACHEWPLPEVKIDLEHLRVEQIQREGSLSEALAIKSETDWDKVIGAIKQLEEYHHAALHRPE